MRIVFLLTFISTNAYAQWIASELIDTTKVHRWIPKFATEY